MIQQPVIPRTNIVGVIRQDGVPLLVHDDGDGMAYTLPADVEIKLYGQYYPSGIGSWPVHASCPGGIPIFLPDIDANPLFIRYLVQAGFVILPWLMILLAWWLFVD